MKQCGRCKEEKSLEEFSKNKTKRDGLAGCCKSCHNDYCKNHYKSNKAYYFKKAKKSLNKVKDFIRKLKESTPCFDCKKYWPSCVMDFDHLSDKKFSIATGCRKVSRQNLLEEINKCELVCANCHRIRTHNRYKK